MELLTIGIGSYFFGRGTAPQFQNLLGVSSLVGLLLKLAFIVAGLILLFYFILGGISIISGAGKDDPKQLEAAKQSLTTGLIGFIVVILSYMIVKLILQLLGITNII